MNCIAITPDDLNLFIKGVVFGSCAMAFAGALLFGLLQRGLEALEDLIRKRGAVTPFRERAERAERLAERFSRLFQRLVERNRREAIRRGDWTDPA